jgi:hypothetical protein
VWYRKLNTSPATLDEKEVLKKPLCMPKVRKVDLHFRLGLTVTARNLKGVTIKDALDAIYKQFKKKVSPSLESSMPVPIGHLLPVQPGCPVQFRFIGSFMLRVLTSLQQDDELDNPVLAGFEWDPEENYQQFIVHLKKEGPPPSKKKKKGGDE